MLYAHVRTCDSPSSICLKPRKKKKKCCFSNALLTKSLARNRLYFVLGTLLYTRHISVRKGTRGCIRVCVRVYYNKNKNKNNTHHEPDRLRLLLNKNYSSSRPKYVGARVVVVRTWTRVERTFPVPGRTGSPGALEKWFNRVIVHV